MIPILWFHIPCIITVYSTSNGSQNDIGIYSGPCSITAQSRFCIHPWSEIFNPKPPVALHILLRSARKSRVLHLCLGLTRVSGSRSAVSGAPSIRLFVLNPI